jgi:hypothetical protein
VSDCKWYNPATAWSPQTRPTCCHHLPPCRAVQYALSKGVDVIVAAGNENQNLDDPKVDSSSPNNVTYANIIQNRPVDLVSPAVPLP